MCVFLIPTLFLSMSPPPTWQALRALHCEFLSVEFAYEGEEGRLDVNGVWKGDRKSYSAKARYLNSGKLYYELYQQYPRGVVKTSFAMGPGVEFRKSATAPGIRRPTQFMDDANSSYALQNYCFARYWVMAYLMQVKQEDTASAVLVGRENLDGLDCYMLKFPKLHAKGWFCVQRGGNAVRWETYDPKDGKLHLRVHNIAFFEALDSEKRKYWLVGGAVADLHRIDGSGASTYGAATPQYRWTFHVVPATVKLNYGPDSKDLEVPFSSRAGVESPKTYAAMKLPEPSESVAKKSVSREEVERAVKDAREQTEEYAAKPPIDSTGWQAFALIALGIGGLTAAFLLLRRARS